jgi:hypothetical protein
VGIAAAKGYLDAVEVRCLGSPLSQSYDCFS